MENLKQTKTKIYFKSNCNYKQWREAVNIKWRYQRSHNDAFWACAQEQTNKSRLAWVQGGRREAVWRKRIKIASKNITPQWSEENVNGVVNKLILWPIWNIKQDYSRWRKRCDKCSNQTYEWNKKATTIPTMSPNM